MVDYRQRIRQLTVDTAHGKRSPYKALLLMWMVGRLLETGASSVRFENAEDPLNQLLEPYRIGSSRTPLAKMPFVHLASDPELWTARDSNGDNIIDMDGNKRRRLTFLREEATGRLAPGFAEYLTEPGQALKIVSELLNYQFPQTTHQEILESAALPANAAPTPHRDPAFTQELLKAYGYRCSFCGFDGRINGKPVGIDAAHIKMHSREGPDTVSNGLLLCVLHHRLFDRGAISITADFEILVSQSYDDSQTLNSPTVLELVGKSIRMPQEGFDTPNPEFVTWHYENLFREPSRVAA